MFISPHLPQSLTVELPSFLLMFPQIPALCFAMALASSARYLLMCLSDQLDWQCLNTRIHSLNLWLFWVPGVVADIHPVVDRHWGNHE